MEYQAKTVSEHLVIKSQLRIFDCANCSLVAGDVINIFRSEGPPSIARVLIAEPGLLHIAIKGGATWRLTPRGPSDFPPDFKKLEGADWVIREKLPAMEHEPETAPSTMGSSA